MEYYLTKEELYHGSIQSQKYGVPEQKKFPLFDLDHVKSAIKFFNYVNPKYENQLAKAILRRAKEYGLDLSEMSIGDNNRFKKYLPNDELYHHGILGQKWGVRRYQNEDGTLTAEGKRRYRLDANGKYVKRSRAERKAYDKKVKQLAEAVKAKKNKSPRGKAINELTDKQLDKYIDRMTKEKRALELRADVNRLDPKPVSRGEQFARKFWDQAIQPALVNAGKSYLDKMVRDLTSAADKAKKAEEAAKQREFDDAKRESLLWTNRANAERQKQAYDELIKIQKDREKEAKEKEAKENEDKEKDKNK